AFCLALALIYSRVDPHVFVDEQVQDPRVQELMGRTRHTPDAPVLTVVLKDGTRFEEKLQLPGDLKGWDAVQKKFRSCISAVPSDGKADQIIDLVSRLDALASIRALTGALPTKAA
ncbi:MAG: hypothetical protein ACREQW_08810, partial [Candidatus Binatia bacterium]